jgi:hypothetical protein
MASPACVQGSICFELVKGIPAAIAALVVGSIATGIAYRQYRVAQAKLKLDLFDKRYAIFLETWTILSEAVIKGTRERQWGLATPFNNFLPQASFLFGQRVTSYLNTASKNWTSLHAFEGDGAANLTPAQLEESKALRQWFEDEAKEGCRKVFGRYLNFERWK